MFIPILSTISKFKIITLYINMAYHTHSTTSRSWQLADPIRNHAKNKILWVFYVVILGQKIFFFFWLISAACSDSSMVIQFCLSKIRHNCKTWLYGLLCHEFFQVSAHNEFSKFKIFRCNFRDFFSCFYCRKSLM